MYPNLLHTTTLIAISAGIACSSSAMAEDSSALERLENARIAYETALAELNAAQAAVAELTGGEVVVVTAAENTSRVQPEAEAEPEVPADPTSWSQGWDWTASVGLTGSSGNTENFSARAALEGERFTTKYETTVGLSYSYASSESDKDTSRGEFNIHNDWLTDSKWRYFAQGKYEYDEFQAWDHRLSGAFGVGYELIKNDKTTLIGRIGVGGSYEAGGSAEEKFIPEGLLGLDWTHQYSENTKMKASTTYYPSFDDLGEFRWVNTAGIEVVMDAETGMTLNTGFEHRHDSAPGSGFKPNDVDYYMGLGWKF